MPLLPGQVLNNRYRLYAEIVSRFRPSRPIPPVPCQFCGQTDYTERFCPKAKETGFLNRIEHSDED